MKCDLLPKHSRATGFFLKILTAAIAALLLLLSAPTDSNAQMFSVGDDRTRFDIPVTAFYAGVEPISVSYYGNDTSSEAGGFAFDGPLIRLRYETPGLNLFLSTGGVITGIDDHSYFDVGGKLEYGLPVYGSRRLSLQIPVELRSVFTTITNSRFIGSGSTFRFGNITAGAGLKVRVRFRDNVRMELNGIPGYGLAFASGGFFGGSLAMITGSGRFYLDNLFGNTGLSFGYDFLHRNYDIDDPLFDYRMNSHSIIIGVTF